MHLKGVTLFISDLHLDEARPAILAQYEQFLSQVAPGADALYILGDLFEYWVGDDGLALALPARVATATRAASRHLPIYFMHGNRDFMAAQDFARAAGLEMLPDPTVIDLYGTRAALLHGDTLCTDDVAYQRFRVQVRNPAWQAAALTRPIEERIAIAQGMRADSGSAKEAKSMEIMDVAPAAVEQAFRDTGCTLMIHGHTHRPGRHVHQVDGRACERWVLADWYQRGGYLEATAEGLRLAQLA